MHQAASQPLIAAHLARLLAFQLAKCNRKK